MRKWIGRGVIAGTIAIVVYFGSAFVVFDFGSRSMHQEYEYDREGREVAIGPRPRWPFDRGEDLEIPGGWDYSGDEPVFRVYQPIVLLWRVATGYADVPRPFE